RLRRWPARLGCLAVFGGCYDMEWSMRRVSETVRQALQYEGAIEKRTEGIRVHVNRNQDGSLYCWLGGSVGKEQAIFTRTMRELLCPVETPRYLLARRRVLRFFREDYFAVPEILARKKEFAEMFARKWRKTVGPVQLVYTRTVEGRKLLLCARGHSLASSRGGRSGLAAGSSGGACLLGLGEDKKRIPHPRSATAADRVSLEAQDRRDYT